ncbi:MAG: hypothetical protein N2C12_11215, partial [Planctomycetales bacterium]
MVTCLFKHVGLIFLVASLSLLAETARAESGSSDAMEAMIRARLKRLPDDSVSWRLVGRLLSRQGDWSGAREALVHSVRLDSENAAAHYDLAKVLLTQREHHLAAGSFKLAIDLAPESEQAVLAATELDRLALNGVAVIAPASFQVPWLDTPQADPVEILPAESPLQFQLESGVLYDSNVELTPISRSLVGPKVSSAQAFLAPDLQYRLFSSGRWEFGSLLNAFFNLNFGDASAFNLQHYKPGFYIESTKGLGDGERIGRIQYDYSYDLFDNETFGDRHALTTSLSTIRDYGCSTVLFWTVDVTDFRDDGTTPSATSLDGWTNTIGLSRAYESEGSWWSLVEFGADLQIAELQGSNFTYRGVMFYVKGEIPACYDILLLPEFGWGYREYPD